VYYREHWPVDDELADDGLPLLYVSICLQGTPPMTTDEQARCMQPRKCCWRVEETLRAERGA
jgi:hypothetical protein